MPLAATDVAKELISQKMPLPSGRPTKWKPVHREHLQEVLNEFDLQIHQLRFSHPRDVFFSRAQRPLWLQPQNLRAEISPDEITQERCKLTLEFQLGPGQYATMLIRALESTLSLDDKSPEDE